MKRLYLSLLVSFFLVTNLNGSDAPRSPGGSAPQSPRNKTKFVLRNSAELMKLKRNNSDQKNGGTDLSKSQPGNRPSTPRPRDLSLLSQRLKELVQEEKADQQKAEPLKNSPIYRRIKRDEQIRELDHKLDAVKYNGKTEEIIDATIKK